MSGVSYRYHIEQRLRFSKLSSSPTDHSITRAHRPCSYCTNTTNRFKRSINATEKIKIKSFFKDTGEQLSFEKFKDFVVPFLLSLGVIIKPPPEPLAQQIFEFVDADGSGRVSSNEALLAIKFLGKCITEQDRAIIKGLKVFADGGEVDFDSFERNVLPHIMNSTEEKKGITSLVSSGEAILMNDSLSAEEKVAKMKELHENASKSEWLKKCGGYETVDANSELVEKWGD